MKLLCFVLNLLSAPVVDEGMSWHPEKALEVLPKAGIGMLVIFVIISVIIIATLLINKLFSSKNKEDK